MELKFKTWLENIEAKVNGIKDTILDFLKDKLNIKDDEEIINMSLNSIDSSVIGQLMSRGLMQNASSDLLNDVKNGNLTVKELIDRLAGDGENQFLIPQKNINSHPGYNEV